MSVLTLWLLTFAVILAFAAVFIIAVKMFSKTERRKRDFYEKADRQRENMLKYGTADKEVLCDAPTMDMIEGIASAVQQEMADSAVPNDAFMKLPPYRRYAYAAYYLLSDSCVKLSAFFRNSGEPLLSTAVECVRKTDEQEFIKLVELEYEMLDDNNDTVSVDEEKLAAWDREFAALDIRVLTEYIGQVILKEKE